ncbi:MAG: hypothetical protein A3D33_00945 [Candidatus Rokubacteria bacterium RIFCSPHIGHO2_02_FULL_73_26]|nr:MAG: hypothetical protein A3D33_00945 [Candidatus Rokubacteria bacterium RIFCSPHIGHO2_02_FULL_73_26]
MQSTAVIFALMAVLPLLTFAYVLQRLGAIQELEYEAALAFALLVSLLGFGVFRAVMLRVSRVLTALGAPAPDGAAPRLDPPERRTVPALGKILELEELPALVDPLSTLWKAEAEPYVGGQVVISVRNSPQPIRGLLCQATDDGLLVETGTARRGITYQRLLAIEADRALSLAS